MEWYQSGRELVAQCGLPGFLQWHLVLLLAWVVGSWSRVGRPLVVYLGGALLELPPVLPTAPNDCGVSYLAVCMVCSTVIYLGSVIIPMDWPFRYWKYIGILETYT